MTNEEKALAELAEKSLEDARMALITVTLVAGELRRHILGHHWYQIREQSKADLDDVNRMLGLLKQPEEGDG